MEYKKAAKRLKEIREAFGWSREKLAKKLDVTPQIVANMEIGRKKIYADDLIDLSQIFNMTADQFLGSNIVFNKELTVDQADLLDKYEQLDRDNQIVVKNLTDDLLNLQKNKVITILPMITESPIRTVELDYYDQAAGMGSGRVVENAIPEKITMPVFNVPENTDFIIRVSGDSMEPTFLSGDRLFIEAKNNLSIGEIGVFNYQGEQLVKELGDGELISHNKKYSPIKIEEDCYIQGKVLGKV